MSLPSQGVAIIRNNEEEEVGRRAVPRGERVAILSNASVSACYSLLSATFINKITCACCVSVQHVVVIVCVWK